MNSKNDGTIEQAEWEAKGKELFGDDKARWCFICPACGNVASIELAKEKWPELKGKGWNPYQECVGRYVAGVGCDWAAYGLFRGPLFIAGGEDDKGVAAFDFDGRPFTKQQERIESCR